MPSKRNKSSKSTTGEAPGAETVADAPEPKPVEPTKPIPEGSVDPRLLADRDAEIAEAERQAAEVKPRPVVGPLPPELAVEREKLIAESGAERSVRESPSTE